MHFTSGTPEYTTGTRTDAKLVVWEAWRNSFLGVIGFNEGVAHRQIAAIGVGESQAATAVSAQGDQSITAGGACPPAENPPQESATVPASSSLAC